MAAEVVLYIHVAEGVDGVCVPFRHGSLWEQAVLQPGPWRCLSAGPEWKTPQTHAHRRGILHCL